MVEPVETTAAVQTRTIPSRAVFVRSRGTTRSVPTRLRPVTVEHPGRVHLPGHTNE
jgi:hypothetical protein